MIALIADTETTGTDHEADQIIELAYQKMYPAAGEARAFQSYYKPSKPIALGATATHHIFFSDLEGARGSEFARGDLPPCDYLIGHNIDFDWRFLGEPNVKRICTLAMSRAMCPELDSHTLTAMAYHVLGQTDETRRRVRAAHSAADDVALTADLLDWIMDKAKVDDLDALYLFSEDCRIPRIMSFGKFKGQSISAVDRGYANWYRRQENPDPYLLEAFRRGGLI